MTRREFEKAWRLLRAVGKSESGRPNALQHYRRVTFQTGHVPPEAIHAAEHCLFWRDYGRHLMKQTTRQRLAVRRSLGGFSHDAC